MNRKDLLSIALSAILLSPLPLEALEAREEALVFYLKGKASVTMAGSCNPVRLHDRLPVGSTLQLDVSATVALVFPSGRRYMLRNWARARLGKKALVARWGSVWELEPVSLGPLLPPLAPDANPGSGGAALRIRERRLAELHP